MILYVLSIMEFHSNKVYKHAFEIFPAFDLANKPDDIISFEEWLVKNNFFNTYYNDISLKTKLLEQYEEQHLDYFAFKLISDSVGYRFCLFNYIENKIDEIKKQYCYEEYSNKFYFLKSRGFNDNTEDYLMRQLPEEFSAFSTGDLYTNDSDYKAYINICESSFNELKNNSFLSENDSLIENIYLTKYQVLNKLRLQIIAKVNRNGEPLPKKEVVNHLSEEELERRRNHEPEPEDILKSVNRSKRMVKDLIRCGNMDQMLTLTYRNLVLDRKEVYNHLKKFFDYLRRGFSIKINGRFKKISPVSFCYVATLEKHKSGGYHVHMAIKGKFNYTYVRWAWQKAVGGNGDELLSNSLGYCKFTKWQNRYTKTSGDSWNARKLASYLSKYMVEDFLKNYVKGQKRYFRSEFIDTPKENYIWLKEKHCENAMFEFYNLTYSLANFKNNNNYMWISKDKSTFLITGEISP